MTVISYPSSVICALLVLLCALPAFAADAPPAAAQQAPVPSPDFTRSFLFTPLEVTALERAAQGIKTGTALLDAGQTVPHIPARRIIAVSGVVWKSAGDWIVWINGKKVTPKNILPEIVDIKVEREKVRLKWFDIGINGIISISLRPHQTYDIVTGVLLPG